jgi:8-oxo-dGTP pyrophosphatase MutT (NUDIX family)
MIPITAAGGVVYQQKEDHYEVLLIYRNGVWDLPKGTREPGEDVEECAQREVAEETGIPWVDIDRFLTKTEHTYKRTKNTYRKTTHWFSMIPDETNDFTPQTEEGIEQVRWFEIQQAEQKVGYDNLKEVLRSFKDSID